MSQGADTLLTVLVQGPSKNRLPRYWSAPPNTNPTTPATKKITPETYEERCHQSRRAGLTRSPLALSDSAINGVRSRLLWGFATARLYVGLARRCRVRTSMTRRSSSPGTRRCGPAGLG